MRKSLADRIETWMRRHPNIWRYILGPLLKVLLGCGLAVVVGHGYRTATTAQAFQRVNTSQNQETKTSDSNNSVNVNNCVVDASGSKDFLSTSSTGAELR